MTLVGARFIKGFYKFYITHKDGIVFVAVDYSGKVLGLVCGGNPRLRGKFSRTHTIFYCPDIMFSAIKSSFARKRLFHHISSAFKKALKTFLPRRQLKKNSVYSTAAQWSSLLSICAVPQCRGTGIGNALMQQFEVESKLRGYEEARLSVHADNNSAINLYKKCGWEIILESDSGIYFKKRLH
jgi:ribosomal protein S18 acetylase RimI-like enzyme